MDGPRPRRRQTAPGRGNSIRAYGGGVVFAFAAHVVDYLQWLIGPVRNVSAYLSARGGPAKPAAHDRAVAPDTLDAMLLNGR